MTSVAATQTPRVHAPQTDAGTPQRTAPHRAVQATRPAGAAVTASRAVTAAVIGGSGYTGGELLRLLLQHPHFQVVAATSGQYAGKPLHAAHPNLRGASDIRFFPRMEPGDIDADVVFTCVPHGTALELVPALLDAGHTVIDLSSDFRLRTQARYEAAYGHPHPRPDLLLDAVYGLPELHREALRDARLISGVGCFATACNLALLPAARAGLLEGSQVVVQGQIGSSAAGIDVNPAGQHAARSRSLRLYAPTGHRHAAEVMQETGMADLHVSVQSTELVRGILATAHILLPPGVTVSERDLWQAFRATYGDEPFVRIVKERGGIHRGPDPKLVAGSNYADVGFHVEGPGGTFGDSTGSDRNTLGDSSDGAAAAPAGDTPSRVADGPFTGRTRIVATCAIDNLVKGAAGSAVQAANLRFGFPETAGLTALPVHPV